MNTTASQRSSWRASVALGAIVLAGLLLSIAFEGYFFGRHDPSNYRAYIFGGSMASLAALSIGFGIRGIELRASKAGCISGMILGTLALLTSAAFLLGTIIPGD